MTVIDTAPLGGATAPVPTLVQLSGNIGIFTTAQLRRRLINTLTHSSDLFVLDLSRVTFCEAGGLGVLVGVQGRARAQGVTLALTGLPPFMARLLRSAGLDRRFPIAA
ncbi:STAS domain-containing protein [Nonomuraea wenchangensis]|uniref:STAS domain-containing protein n=1 Tax=Nonomuraea wenchangensis TaxID=568860 RepID=UPI0033D16272